MPRIDPVALGIEPTHPDSFGVLLRRQFHDADELAAYVTEASDLRITPLSLNPFCCDAMTLNLGAIRFSFNRANSAVSVGGKKTPGFLVFVLLPHGTKRPIVCHGKSITDKFVFGFDMNRGVDFVFPADSTYCSVSVRKDVFDACIQALDRDDLNATFLASNYCYLPDTMGSLQAYLDQLYALFVCGDSRLQQPNFQQIILKNFLPLLVAALPLQKDHFKIRVKEFQRLHLVKQAEDYMLTHLDQPLTLTDLGKALHTSSRALSYGFQDIFGISPMAYLKNLRLQSVYRALKTANPSCESIASLASRHGFWSLNHFTKDYKTMFGETPSVTLAKASNLSLSFIESR